jgi:hypothetical protein
MTPMDVLSVVGCGKALFRSTLRHGALRVGLRPLGDSSGQGTLQMDLAQSKGI